MLQARAGAPLAPARGRTRVRTLALLSPPPPGGPPPPPRERAGTKQGPSPSSSPSPNAPPPATNGNKAARQLLEELRTLTFQNTLEREQQQQDAARRQQRRSRGGGGGASGPSSSSGVLRRTTTAAPSSLSSSGGEEDDDGDDDGRPLVAIAEEGDTLLPRLPSSRSLELPGGDGGGANGASSSSLPSTSRAETALRREGPSSSSSPPPPSGSSAAPSLPADAVLYFAFGANLSAATLRRRGVYEVYAHEPAFVEDPATRLAFRHRGGYATLWGVAAPAAASSGDSERRRSVSPSRVGVLGALQGASEARAPEDAGGRAASAAAALAAGSEPPPHVHGVLYALSRADLGRLSGAEGGYSLKSVDVVTYGGRRERALTFVSGRMAALPADVKPTERYLSLVREGAADHHLDPVWQAWLSGLETVSSAGLGPEYFDSPSKHLGTAFLAACAIGMAAWLAHTGAAPPPTPLN